MVKLTKAFPRGGKNPWERASRVAAQRYVDKTKCAECRKKCVWRGAWGSLMIQFDFGNVACSAKCARKVGCLT